jgi:hypothetical protein
MGVNVSEGVEKLPRLVPHRFDHPRVTVSHGHDAESRSEVYIDVAVDVPDVRPPGFLPENRGREGIARRHPR